MNVTILSFHYMLLLSVDMKLSVIILTIYVLMDSTSGNCPNCPDGELNIRPAKIDVQFIITLTNF